MNEHYDRLTALDHSFLVLERSNAYTHVASTLVFDAGPLRAADGGIDFERIRKAHAARLHLIPRYRQVLRWIPLEQHPVWVDDPDFSLDYHLRHTALPRPGSEEQLKSLSARVMAQHLDRSRPLWETWVVEGLEGDRFALISKVHHCMIDGISGVDILQTLLSPDPQAPLPDSPPFHPRPAPHGLRLLRDALARGAALPLRALRDLGDFAREARDLRRELMLRSRAIAETLGASLRSPSRTSLNQRIGPHRRFDWLAMPIGEIKLVRSRIGGSLNDVVLTVATGAFRRFFTARGEDVRELEFRAMTPVSVRSQDERGALGNRVSAWIVPLPLDEPDPRLQLDRIGEHTVRLKESKQATAASVLSQVAEWTPSTLLSLGARNATRLLPFNTVITNVPGPQIPVYLEGAQMRAAYPHVPLVDHLGLGIALMSYAGVLHWGVNADYDLVPDLAEFMGALRDSWQSLRKAAGIEAAPPAD